MLLTGKWGGNVPKLTLNSDITTINGSLLVPSGAVLNHIAIGIDPSPVEGIGDITFPYSYETIGTIDPRHNLRLHSGQAIYFHNGNSQKPSVIFDKEGNTTLNNQLTIYGTTTKFMGLAGGFHWITVGGDSINTHGILGLYYDPNDDFKTQLYVSGKLSAIQKNFIIDHPLDPEHKQLVHSSLEGPEVAVFYRGEAQLLDGRIEIALPNYFEALTRKEGRSILLTPKFEINESTSAIACSEIVDGRFNVKMIDEKNASQKFYWEVKALRADIPLLEVERFR